jgi:hypothetical protein
MDGDREKQFSKLLEYFSDSLDMPETRYKEAEERYKAVGTWLGQEDSSLASYKPEIYPQGSFKLGTVVKPVSQTDEYDIDLVCQLELLKHDIIQQELKRIVGERLKANGNYARMLDKEGKRCWTLNYAESAKFHMDILPSVPDEYGWLLRQGIPHEFAQHAVCITDKEEPDWFFSNPKGYAEWFKDRMKTILLEGKRIFAAESRVEIEDVPDYSVKTPLQRAVQILKRHRDIMFERDKDNKPVSIIITTLAARAYNNQADLYEALTSIIDGMTEHIENDGGVLSVFNPVNPEENFADKWQEHPERATKFISWLQQIKKDLKSALKERSISIVAGSMKAAFGEKAVNEAVERFGKAYTAQREAGTLKMMAGTGILGTTGTTPVKKHTFYGI